MWGTEGPYTRCNEPVRPIYRTYKVVVGRCLPEASWGMTVAGDVLEDMHVAKVDTYRSHVV
jgi:hypothetical protein